MNTRRQTVWLVSMLSLMVVLSAYYLFTDDGKKNNQFAAGNQGTQTIDVKEVTGGDGQTSAQASAGDAAKSDQDILNQLETQQVSASDFFVQAQMQREDNYKKQMDQLMNVTGSKDKSNDEIAKAYEQERQLEETHAKILDLESQLTKQYADAIILEKDSKYSVVIEAPKLEKSEAVSIADQVMKELSLKPQDLVIKLVQK